MKMGEGEQIVKEKHLPELTCVRVLGIDFIPNFSPEYHIKREERSKLYLGQCLKCFQKYMKKDVLRELGFDPSWSIRHQVDCLTGGNKGILKTQQKVSKTVPEYSGMNYKERRAFLELTKLGERKKREDRMITFSLVGGHDRINIDQFPEIQRNTR